MLGTWCRMGGRVRPFRCFLGCPGRHNTGLTVFASSSTRCSSGEECLYVVGSLSDDKLVVEECA